MVLRSYRQLVILVRHGQAVNTEQDPTRPLSVTGRQQAERMASWLADMSLEVDELRHSGKARALQTAEILAERLCVKPAQIKQVAGLAPNDDPEPMALELETNGRSVVLVGHLPYMNRLAGRLLANDPARLALRFAEAGTAILARTGGSWQLVALLSPEMR